MKHVQGNQDRILSTKNQNNFTAIWPNCFMKKGDDLLNEFFFLTVAVEIGFQQDTYTVTEASGAAMVCVILNGSIARNVSATLFTMDIDAVGRTCKFACRCAYLSFLRRFSLFTGYW